VGTPVRVTIEAAARRTFAVATDWPGWSRRGRTEADALANLAAAADRYADIAAVAGVPLPPAGDRIYEVVERVTGNAGTDFGVPGQVTAEERRPVDAAEADRAVRLLAAAWESFDRIAVAAPEELRKGPRGGGRDRSRIVAHVVESDQYYARELGLRLKAFDPGDRIAHAALREAMLEILRRPSDGQPLAGRKWPHRHARNYIAWHALDHAWEILDRS
jgi:hypothetical protein